MRTLLRAVSIIATTLAVCSSAIAQTTTYVEATRQLTLPSVQVGNINYSNVVLRLDNFTILAAGPGVVTNGAGGGNSNVLSVCGTANINTEKYNAVVIGMTLDQVKQTLGCENNPSLTQRGAGYVIYTWSLATVYPYIFVYFNEAGTLVTSLAGGTTFKASFGF